MREVDEARAVCELLIARGMNVSAMSRAVKRLSSAPLDADDIETSRLELEGAAEAAEELCWPVAAGRLNSAAMLLRTAEIEARRRKLH